MGLSVGNKTVFLRTDRDRWMRGARDMQAARGESDSEESFRCDTNMIKCVRKRESVTRRRQMGKRLMGTAKCEETDN